MMILGGIPAKEDHKAPGKSLAGDDSRRHGKTLAKDTHRATIRPTPIQTSTTVRMQLPTQPVGQAPAWQQVDLRGDPPLHHLSCLPAYMAPRAPLAGAWVDAKGISNGQDWALPCPR